MVGRIGGGQLITIAPVSFSDIRVDDIVFCRVKGNFYVHLVKAIGQDGRLQIGNNHGHMGARGRALPQRRSRVAS
jgi:hypothetical protein